MGSKRRTDTDVAYRIGCAINRMKTQRITSVDQFFEKGMNSPDIATQMVKAGICKKVDGAYQAVEGINPSDFSSQINEDAKKRKDELANKLKEKKRRLEEEKRANIQVLIVPEPAQPSTQESDGVQMELGIGPTPDARAVILKRLDDVCHSLEETNKSVLEFISEIRALN